MDMRLWLLLLLLLLLLRVRTTLCDCGITSLLLTMLHDTLIIVLQGLGVCG